jgi:hypothetical protein
VAKSYSFYPAVVDPTNWIYQYVQYAKDCTDAPHEYHEAYAVMLLSLLTQGLRLDVSTTPGGLRTNLYMLIYGKSSIMRKSTAMKLAKDVLNRVVGGVMLPENFTPGGLEEEMAKRSGQPAILFVDEFAGIMDRMHHQSYMAGTRSFLLTMHGHDDWRYVRREKKGKEDAWEVTDPHLCIIGNLTTAFMSRMKLEDIEDGFLARFAVIGPQDKPERMSLRDLQPADPGKRLDVANGLHAIHDRVKYARERCPAASLDGEAINALDEFQAETERAQMKADDSTTIMLERVSEMSMKLALLIAAGRPNGFGRDGRLVVVRTDAEQAVSMARKWAYWATEFVRSATPAEVNRHIAKATVWMERNGGSLPRWKVARALGISSYKVDEVQSAMIDQNLLTVAEVCKNGSKKPTLMWTLKPNEADEIEITEA